MMNTKWIAILIVVILLAGAGYWYYAKRRPTAQPPVGAPIKQSTLGGAIYDQAANPVQGKLPASVVPVPNPVGDLYKNPFK